eukprot:5329216-Pyramimonas_sp.AAC.1
MRWKQWGSGRYNGGGDSGEGGGESRGRRWAVGQWDRGAAGTAAGTVGAVVGTVGQLSETAERGQWDSGGSGDSRAVVVAVET